MVMSSVMIVCSASNDAPFGSSRRKLTSKGYRLPDESTVREDWMLVTVQAACAVAPLSLAARHA
jgi:hypothetical protein